MASASQIPQREDRVKHILRIHTSSMGDQWPVGNQRAAGGQIALIDKGAGVGAAMRSDVPVLRKKTHAPPCRSRPLDSQCHRLQQGASSEKAAATGGAIAYMRGAMASNISRNPPTRRLNRRCAFRIKSNWRQLEQRRTPIF